MRLGTLRQVGTLSNPGVAVSDGDGGFTQTPYVALDPPEWRFSLVSASAGRAERQFAATIIAEATYMFTGRFHPGIVTETQIVWTDRAGASHTGRVLAVDDPEGAGVQTTVLVSEIVQ